MPNKILIPILCVLIAWFIRIRYKEVSDKRAKFAKEHSDFADTFLEFIECLNSKDIALNPEIRSGFPQHKRAKDAFIHNLKGSCLDRFNKKWTEYEYEYNQVNDLGVFGIVAAIAPSSEALAHATPDDPSKWEADRKQKIHTIITELLEISKVKIWF